MIKNTATDSEVRGGKILRLLITDKAVISCHPIRKKIDIGLHSTHTLGMGAGES